MCLCVLNNEASLDILLGYWQLCKKRDEQNDKNTVDYRRVQEVEKPAFGSRRNAATKALPVLGSHPLMRSI
jgi:hypothetical protein